MKNVIIFIMAILIIGLGGFVVYNYLQQAENNSPPTFTRPEVTPQPLDGVNKPEKLFNPELLGTLKTDPDCKEECDNSCGDKRKDCEDNCDDEHNDVCTQASAELAACNHNCQFIPFPPGPGPCWNKCEEVFEKRCDNDDLKSCQQDCKELNYICLEDCYGDC